MCLYWEARCCFKHVKSTAGCKFQTSLFLVTLLCFQEVPMYILILYYAKFTMFHALHCITVTCDWLLGPIAMQAYSGVLFLCVFQSVHQEQHTVVMLRSFVKLRLVLANAVFVTFRVYPKMRLFAQRFPLFEVHSHAIRE